MYLGSTEVTTDGTGNAAISAVLNGVTEPMGDRVTATATRRLGGSTYASTSKFGINVIAISDTAQANNGSGLNDETNESHSIIVRASSEDGSWSVMTIEIAVLNVAERPITCKQTTAVMNMDQVVTTVIASGVILFALHVSQILTTLITSAPSWIHVDVVSTLDRLSKEKNASDEASAKIFE